MVKVPAAQPAPRVPRSRRDDRYETGHQAGEKRTTAGYVVSIQDTYDTVTVDVLDEELTGVIPLGDMPPLGAIVEVEARGDLLVIPVWFEGPPPVELGWMPFEITTDMPTYTGQAQNGTRAYYDHWELRQERSGATVTVQLFDLAIGTTGPVSRTLVDTDTYSLSSSSVIPVSLEWLGDTRFFVVLTDGAGTLSAARVIDTAGGAISIGPQQTFTNVPAAVSGYQVLGINPTTAVATAHNASPNYDAYWWQFTISGATVTRSTPVIDNGTSGAFWARTPIIAMPDGKILSDSILSPANSQRLAVHSTDGTVLSDITLGVYDDVRISANIGTQNGHGGVDEAGRAVLATWYRLVGETRGSTTVRAYAVSSTLTEMAHLDVVPEFTDPDQVWMDVWHFSNLGAGSEFLIVGTYDWMASTAAVNFVKIVNTETMTVTDIATPAGSLDNSPWLQMTINEDAFLLTYGSDLSVYHEYLYVRREL